MEEKNNRVVITLPSGAHFEAEGPADLVKELWSAFIEETRKPVSTPVPQAATKHGAGTPPATENPATANQSPAHGLSQALIDRLFAIDKNGTVSLLALPTGDSRHAEALLALLFGFATLKGETAVTAMRLMKAAKQSGVQIPRIDRVIAGQSQFITSAGSGKAKRYGLNNPGQTRAQEIVRGILG